jgi:MFS family permease
MLISIPKTVQEGEKVTVRGIFNDTKTAVKVIFLDSRLKLFVPCLLILNLLASGPFTLILPFTIEKGFPVEQYGLLMSVWTLASLVGVFLLGIIKFGPRARFWILAIGFTLSEIFMIAAFLSKEFVTMCILAFIGALLNAVGNAIFNSSMMLALPEKNRGAIMGFISSASVGGCAISAVLYGVLGDIFPLYIIFAVGGAISLIPMLYMCFHPQTKSFIIENT